MPDQFLYAIEVTINGLMAGVLYALVALGFVLIFKSSGIFNYAQGVFALFAALTLVGIMEGQVPFSHLINAIFGTEVHHFGWHVPSLIAIALTIGMISGWLTRCRNMYRSTTIASNTITPIVSAIAMSEGTCQPK